MLKLKKIEISKFKNFYSAVFFLISHMSSLVCWELAGLLSSKCRGRSRKIINMHNGRVSVEVGRGKSLICITVESTTSPIVITKGKNAFPHTNVDFLHTNSV